jgi:hypothetical protein
MVFVNVCLCTLLKNMLSNTVGSTVNYKILNQTPASVPDPVP